MPTDRANLYEFGDFQLDPAKRLLRRSDGTPVPLTSRVFDTLLYMLEHHDTVLDKERIMEAVWPDSIVEENNLAQAISKLRQIFGETPGSHSYIVTVPGRGYRFVADVNRRTFVIVAPQRSDSGETDASSTAHLERRPSEEPIQKSTPQVCQSVELIPQRAFEAPTTEFRSVSRLPAKTGWLWIAAAIVILGVVAFFLVRVQEPSSPTKTSSIAASIPEKSVAVLPFDNLSDEKENAYFAAGVQDEITSNLAKIAELKVISRTSANLYKSGNPRNSREIGQQLGVEHLLEGNVQRIGNRLRINAQLIKAPTDTHVWAQTYDRNVADLFAIQSEIAQTIAAQLYAKISPTEKLAIEQPPTSDLTAFDLYTRAKDLSLRSPFTNTGKKDLLEAVDLLNQAVTRDPAFFVAFCELAFAHDYLYFFGHDRTPARLALAEAAIQAAFRLRPDAGEAHVARAENLYRGYLDYDGALAELKVAGQTLPNDAHVFQLRGSIERRRGRWEESIRSLERAVDLDPRNIHTLQQLAGTYAFLRQYAEAKSACERALAIAPDDVESKLGVADVEFDSKANTTPLHQLIDSVRADSPDAIADMASPWFICALAERDPAAARDALIAAGQSVSPGNQAIRFNRPLAEGIIARMTKDENKAQSAFMTARAEQEKIVEAEPNHGPSLVVLGLIDAALGRKKEAMQEGQRAVELLPVQKDAINGPQMIEYLAMIAAWVGDNELACEKLGAAIRYPGSLGYGQLKLLPFWDPLRGDPRFEKIVASLAPN